MEGPVPRLHAKSHAMSTINFLKEPSCNIRKLLFRRRVPHSFQQHHLTAEAQILQKLRVRLHLLVGAEIISAKQPKEWRLPCWLSRLKDRWVLQNRCWQPP